MLDTKLHWSEGNKRADSAAESALNLAPDKFKIPYFDLKPKIDRFIRTKWQKYGNNSNHNKLY